REARLLARPRGLGDVHLRPDRAAVHAHARRERDRRRAQPARLHELDGRRPGAELRPGGHAADAAHRRPAALPHRAPQPPLLTPAEDPRMRYVMPARRAAVALGALAALAACDRVRQNLLDAPDPDIISPTAVQSPEGAEALRIGALSRLRTITAGGEGAWMLGGLMVDEWKSSDTFSQ